jgi:hypothetical protein
VKFSLCNKGEYTLKLMKLPDEILGSRKSIVNALFRKDWTIHSTPLHLYKIRADSFRTIGYIFIFLQKRLYSLRTSRVNFIHCYISRKMVDIKFVTPEEAKNTALIKSLYTAFSIICVINILLDMTLIKATIMNK